MIFEKTVTFKEPIQKVWDKIADFDKTIRCMPGVKSVTPAGDNKYQVVVEQKVGFISVKFNMELKITDLKPPTHLETAADGTALEGMGKAFEKQTLDLVAVSDSETRLHFKADMTVSGRIGTFGQRVLGGKIGSISQEFLDNFIASSGLKVAEK